MSVAGGLLAEFEQEAQATRRVLEQVPEDKLAWRPHPKSLSLGQLALHVAAVPANVTRIAAVDTFEMGGRTYAEAGSRRELLDALETSIRQVREFLSGLSDERASQTWSMTKDGRTLMAVPRSAFIRMVMFNHLYHHRGELCVYLRLLDLPVPSVYGPSADEDPFALPKREAATV